jgi:hypothetical protein
MILKTPLTPKPTRLAYYARSVRTLIGGVRPSRGALGLLISRSLERPHLVTLRSNGLRFFVRDRLDVWMLKEVCLDRDYERVGSPIDDGWTIVDIGAGIGEFAIDIAARHPRSIVHAFEPSPVAYELLCRNIALNGVRNIRTYQIALGSPTAPAPSSGPPWPLEIAFRNAGIARCDFLKIDCEGNEYDILLNAPAAVLDRIARICLEHHEASGHRLDDLVAGMRRAGFFTRLTDNPAYYELGFLYAWRP